MSFRTVIAEAATAVTFGVGKHAAPSVVTPTVASPEAHLAASLGVMSMFNLSELSDVGTKIKAFMESAESRIASIESTVAEILAIVKKVDAILPVGPVNDAVAGLTAADDALKEIGDVAVASTKPAPAPAA